MESQPVPPPLPSNPPPILPAADRHGIVFKNRIVPGTENLTATDIAEEVLAGGRFVFFQYCFSVIFMTFRRPTDLVFLKRKDDAGRHALGWSLLSLCVGWWGFPWGPIYTIGSLVTNARGGKDVTREVLASVLPATAIEPLMKQRRRPSAGPLLWLLRVVLIAAVFVPVAMIVAVDAFEATREAAQQKQPGHAAFGAAEHSVDNRSGATTGGNTPEAQTIAADFCRAMTTGRDELFTRKSGTSNSSSPQEFHAWCELHPGSCVILLKVPDLRHFDSGAKDTMCQLAWAMAQNAVAKHRAAQDVTTLAVAVRGFALYERLMTGNLHATQGEEAPTTSITDHSEIRSRLVERFAPAAIAR